MEPLSNQIDYRREDIARRKNRVSLYVLDPEFKLTGQAEPYEPQSYNMLLEWLLGAAILAAEKSDNPFIRDLLRDLQLWRAHVNEVKPSGWNGPVVTLVGDIGRPIQATGETRDNWLKLTIGIPRRDPSEILGSFECKEIRNELVADLALCFVHEGVHLWQINKYKNDSHPWIRPGAEALDFSMQDPGIEYVAWPGSVQKAYDELAAGGRNKVAADYSEWRRVSKAIAADAYHRAGSWDRRGRELVSHLVELAYTWKLAQPFEQVFPLCAALLTDVMQKFEFKPKGS